MPSPRVGSTTDASSIATETLTIPASVVPGFGGLHVEMSSTAMVGLVGPAQDGLTQEELAARAAELAPLLGLDTLTYLIALEEIASGRSLTFAQLDARAAKGPPVKKGGRRKTSKKKSS